MATFNSKTGFTPKWALVLGIWRVTAGFAVAGDVDTNIFAARAEAEFHRTEKQYQSNTNDVTTAWKFACACFNFADFATNDAEHAAIARQGSPARTTAACRQIEQRSGESVVHFRAK